jgi:diguanylate cyclase (GGDEF)-like protein/PAS domain S-box-containing protein
MRFTQLNKYKNKLRITAKKFINYLLFENPDVVYDKSGVEYWKSKIFTLISACLIFLSAPLFFYGAYMFNETGDNLEAIIEIFIYFLIAEVLTQKSLSISFRKFFMVSILYSISITLLITTGVNGAGMVCALFSLILAGCLLDGKQANYVAVINIIIFIVLTILLMHGYLDGTQMKTYKNVWFINATTTQVCGIILLLLINAIFKGLENQTQLIRESKESLAESEAKHKTMIDNISDVIVIIDDNGIIKYNSPNMEEKSGWMTKDFSNRSIWEELHPEEREHIKGELQGLLEENGLKKTMETRGICKDGSIKHIEFTAVNLKMDSSIKGILINFHDITERKIREEEILHLNYHDSLTGLYNRTFFKKEVECLDTESQLPLSVIIGDINGLKLINDSLGHGEGDKLLVGIGKILDSCCRKEDIPARTGGDEFSILLPRTNNETAYEIVKKINSACEEYNKKVSNELYYTSISLGYATKTSMEETFNDILKDAEDHMNNRKLLESKSIHSSIISSMKTALFEKSQETEEHAQRLIKLSRAVGEVIGLTDQQFDELELFSTLHDIGKIGIDDQVLNKTGKLTDGSTARRRWTRGC